MGALTPLVVGDALFLAGAVVILVSLGRIRLGGARKKVIHRDLQGRRLFTEMVVAPERAQEIRQGLALFALGLALWAPLPVLYILSR